jgi:hypothetical protein
VPRATAAEICDYYQRVLDEQLLPSGRVRFLGMSDYVGAAGGEQHFRSRLTGDITTVRVRRRIVDARYLEPSIPATHVPAFDADPGARRIPVNDLVKLDGPASGFTIIGAGKTAMDACLWLLDACVPPEAIRWIRPRDAWLLDRAFQQPLELVPKLIEGVSLYLEAAALADDVSDLFRRLEACGQLTRLDLDVEPTMFRCATVSQARYRRQRSQARRRPQPYRPVQEPQGPRGPPRPARHPIPPGPLHHSGTPRHHAGTENANAQAAAAAVAEHSSSGHTEIMVMIYVTGLFGTGKSAVLEELRARGYDAPRRRRGRLRRRDRQGVPNPEHLPVDDSHSDCHAWPRVGMIEVAGTIEASRPLGHAGPAAAWAGGAVGVEDAGPGGQTVQVGVAVPGGLTELADRWVLPFGGLTVTQVVVDFEFTLVLGEDCRVSIATLGRAAGNMKPEITELRPERQDVAAGLALFTASVVSAVAFKSGALRIVFDDGHMLTVAADPVHEAWKANGPGPGGHRHLAATAPRSGRGQRSTALRSATGAASRPASSTSTRQPPPPADLTTTPDRRGRCAGTRFCDNALTTADGADGENRRKSCQPAVPGSPASGAAGGDRLPQVSADAGPCRPPAARTPGRLPVCRQHKTPPACSGWPKLPADGLLAARPAVTCTRISSPPGRSWSTIA